MADRTVPDDFAYRLRTARRHAGLGVGTLSAAMALPRGASASSLKLYEKNKLLDPLVADKFIERIATATQIPAEYFWGDDAAFPASRHARIAAAPDTDASLLMAIKEHVEMLEAQQRRLQEQMAALLGLLTNDPEATASFGDRVARIIEDAMTQRGEKVGLRGRQPLQPPTQPTKRHAA